MKGRYPNRLIQEYDRFIITIWRALVDAFWSQKPGTVRINLTMLRNMGMMVKEYLGLEGWFPLMGTYTLKYKVGDGIDMCNLIFSLIKGGYVGHLQWDIISSSPTE